MGVSPSCPKLILREEATITIFFRLKMCSFVLGGGGEDSRRRSINLSSKSSLSKEFFEIFNFKIKTFQR